MDSPFPCHAHVEWREEQSLVLAGGLKWCCHNVFETGTVELDKDWMCQRPYNMTMARWVKAFKEGCQNVADMCWPGCSSVSEEECMLFLCYWRRIDTIWFVSWPKIQLCFTFWRNAWAWEKLHHDGFHMIWRKCRNDYNTTLLIPTWSAVSAKERLSYAISLRWMRHGPNRTSHTFPLGHKPSLGVKQRCPWLWVWKL
jgi:hypothetical protein